MRDNKGILCLSTTKHASARLTYIVSHRAQRKSSVTCCGLGRQDLYALALLPPSAVTEDQDSAKTVVQLAAQPGR